MIHNYMEHVERIKLQQQNESSDSGTLGRVRWVLYPGHGHDFLTWNMSNFNEDLGSFSHSLLDNHLQTTTCWTLCMDMLSFEMVSKIFISCRKERPLSLGIFPVSGGGSSILLEPLARAETPGAESWRFNDLAHPRSNASLKVGSLKKKLHIIDGTVGERQESREREGQHVQE